MLGWAGGWVGSRSLDLGGERLALHKYLYQAVRPEYFFLSISTISVLTS